ncbi:MAG: hypothetical protein NVS2B9_19960 [Myxococcales bacterium]
MARAVSGETALPSAAPRVNVRAMTKDRKKPGPARVALEADARQRREHVRQEQHEQEAAPPDPEGIAKVGELVRGIEIAMLTMADADGSLRSLPMYTQKTEFDGTVWFMTGKSTRKVVEIENDRHVCLSYADPKTSRYVSLSGRASLVDDRKKIDELWSPLYRAFFPDGKDDPDIVLLRVDVESAEYWDTPGSKVVQVLGFAKAILTGQAYHPGEYEQVKLQ